MQEMENSIKNQDSQKQARDRLLDAAEKSFAEKGFDGTGVRELTAKAHCNIAAVNYHFGGKDNLYIEVFRRRLSALCEARIRSIEQVMSRSDDEVTLEELLRAFAKSFVEPLVDQASGPVFMKLMIREISDPRLPKRMFLEEMILPTLRVFERAIVRICPGMDERTVVLCLVSVVGQLMHIVSVGEMFGHGGDGDLPIPSLDEIVEHVVEFSAAGIRGLIRGYS